MALVAGLSATLFTQPSMALTDCEVLKELKAREWANEIVGPWRNAKWLNVYEESHVILANSLSDMTENECLQLLADM